MSRQLLPAFLMERLRRPLRKGQSPKTADAEACFYKAGLCFILSFVFPRKKDRQCSGSGVGADR